jgi:hypothetical protein
MQDSSANLTEYKLPRQLSQFQQKMYEHLIRWKWTHITREPGVFRDREYDAILPDSLAKQYPVIFEPIRQSLKEYQEGEHRFRPHKYFNHMASSQAANINLFLPVLFHKNASKILGAVKPDFKRLATDKLYNGFYLEYFDKDNRLNDKTKTTGTDSDIAIAYYNSSDSLCLWLIEHKLTEKEFTTCGGAKSKGNKAKENCGKSFGEILNNSQLCYYQYKKEYSYWDITRQNLDFFRNPPDGPCPFRGGMNQLWRNQLMALAIEKGPQPYSQVFFSVVRHPENEALNGTLDEYRKFCGNNPKFSVFTSQDILDAAKKHGDKELNQWIDWYQALYNLK